MPRTFNGTTERISAALGAMGGTFFGTLAAIIRTTGTGGQGIIAYPGTTDRLGINLVAVSNLVSARIGNGLVTAPTIAALTTDGWVLVAWSKPTGTSTVRFHKYVFATGVWTHENGGTNADTAAITSGPTIGSIAGASFFAGEIAMAGIWRANALSDAQIESLVGSLMAWWQLPPTTLWPLDQDPVSQLMPDMTGGGANQTAIIGTSVGTNSCPFGYGQEYDAT